MAHLILYRTSMRTANNIFNEYVKTRTANNRLQKNRPLNELYFLHDMESVRNNPSPAEVIGLESENAEQVPRLPDIIEDVPRTHGFSGTTEDNASSFSTIPDELEVGIERALTNTKFLLKLFTISSVGLLHIWLMVSIVILSVDVPYRCGIDDIENSNFTEEQKANLSAVLSTEDMCSYLPVDLKKVKGASFYDTYEYAVEVQSKSDVPLLKCDYFVFENPDATMVSTFSLVCDRRPLLYEYQIAGFMGMALGAPITGCFSDQYGRRIVYIVCVFVSCILFPLPAIVAKFWSFLITNFLCGFANLGAFYTGFVIIIEWVRPIDRTVMGILYHVPISVGLLWIAILSYCIPEWRYLQMAVSFPAVCIIITCFSVVESPRWLISQGLREATWKMIQNINPTLRPTEGDPTKPPQKPEELSKTCFHYYNRLYSHRELRLRLLICCAGWLFSVMLYYYLVLGAATFSYGIMNLYLGALAVVDLMSYATCAIAMKGNCMCITGFKPIVSVLLCGTGVIVVGLSLMPFNVVSLIFITSLMARVGITSVLTFMTIHTVQLFPTKCRNNAVGLCAMFSFFTGIVIPFLILLHFKINIVVGGCVFWAGCVICAIILLFLPKTYGDSELADTLDDVETEIKNHYKVKFRNFRSFP